MAEELPPGFLQPPDRPGGLGKLGHYDILEVVGRGAMGIVFRARDDRLHRVVAIKVMAPQLAASASARTLDCPSVGQGSSGGFSSNVVAGLGREMSQRSVAYAQLVATYQAQNPQAGVTDTALHQLSKLVEAKTYETDAVLFEE